jgi:hypothetical protein
MRGALPPVLSTSLRAWCLVKYRDNFTFTFIQETNSSTQPESFHTASVTESSQNVLKVCV